MNRPVSDVLTERELEVMHAFWRYGELSAQSARDHLEAAGRPLTYTTVATLCRLLSEKGFLQRMGDVRPFAFRPTRTFDEVSKSLVSTMISKVFGGSRKQLLLQVFDKDQLNARQRQLLESLLQDEWTEGEHA
jgi:BlaI family transcriptional regulator, penicillinase repressor